ncbi:hypothetical protein [Nitrosomonas communis]|uniref:hypothetical protein n=1 Tax=Nitrosomonas communis TaxID=44574 RepID=UPI0009431C69|nr:hypothetical protein [Nitrosomonas communis]
MLFVIQPPNAKHTNVQTMLDIADIVAATIGWLYGRGGNTKSSSITEDVRNTDLAALLKCILACFRIGRWV